MIEAHSIAQIALARRFGLAPAPAAMILHLYKARSPQSELQISEGAGTSIGSIRVHLSHIRSALGSGSLPPQGNWGCPRYKLSTEARSEIRAILADMAQEVSHYLAPLIAQEAA